MRIGEGGLSHSQVCTHDKNKIAFMLALCNVLICKKIPSFPSKKVLLHTTSGASKPIKRYILILFIYKPFEIVIQALMNQWYIMCNDN